MRPRNGEELMGAIGRKETPSRDGEIAAAEPEPSVLALQTCRRTQNTRGCPVEGSAPPNLRPTAAGVEGDPLPNLRRNRSWRRVADRYVS